RAAVPPAADWSVEWHRDEQALVGLGDELRDLYDRSPAATPFQAYEWLRSWWGWYGTSGRLRLAVVRCRGRVVAAAPLMAGVRHGFPVLLPLAGEQSDFTDLLVDPVYADGAARHLTRALLDEHGWCALGLREFRPGAPAHQAARRGARRAWRPPASSTPCTPTAPSGTSPGRCWTSTAGARSTCARCGPVRRRTCWPSGGRAGRGGCRRRSAWSCPPPGSTRSSIGCRAAPPERCGRSSARSTSAASRSGPSRRRRPRTPSTRYWTCTSGSGGAVPSTPSTRASGSGGTCPRPRAGWSARGGPPSCSTGGTTASSPATSC